MLDLSTAVLCDFAQVRDRLLFVSSGAVSRLYRRELPSPLGLMVGLVIEVPLEDAGTDHELTAEVVNRQGTELATLHNTFRVGDEGLFPHEVQQVPMVLSITGVRTRTWGTHQVRIYLDGTFARGLTFYVVPAAGAQGPRPPIQHANRRTDEAPAPADAGAQAEAPTDAVTATESLDDATLANVEGAEGFTPEVTDAVPVVKIDEDEAAEGTDGGDRAADAPAADDPAAGDAEAATKE